MADLQMTDANGKLRTRTKIFYGIGDLGNAMVNSAIQFFLMKFYTDGALILPALAGNALLIGKIWDAINDPLFGWVSDRTKSRLGKRRVFMIYGAIPLALCIALLWYVPRDIGQLLTFVWIALSFAFFDTFWTLTNVPYYALTSELTDDYDERSSLTTVRMVMAVPAYLVGAALTPAIVGLFAVQRTGLFPPRCCSSQPPACGSESCRLQWRASRRPSNHLPWRLRISRLYGSARPISPLISRSPSSRS
jgi:GPH family glycoside/pentoside/hexuronide:cation symporter